MTLKFSTAFLMHDNYDTNRWDGLLLAIDLLTGQNDTEVPNLKM